MLLILEAETGEQIICEIGAKSVRRPEIGYFAATKEIMAVARWFVQNPKNSSWYSHRGDVCLGRNNGLSL